MSAEVTICKPWTREAAGSQVLMECPPAAGRTYLGRGEGGKAGRARPCCSCLEAHSEGRAFPHLLRCRAGTPSPEAERTASNAAAQPGRLDAAAPVGAGQAVGSDGGGALWE